MSFNGLKEISVFPASAPINPAMESEFDEFFNDLGISIRYLLSPYEGYGTHENLFSAQSATDRVAALKVELADPTPRLILASRGGVGAQEICEQIQTIPVPSAPKIFCGFSDFCFLLEALTQKGCTAIHGPSFLSFRKEVDDHKRQATFDHLMAILGGAIELISANDCKHFGGPIDSVAGELAGGNLTVFCSLLGTPYEMPIEGKILFFEEIGEVPHRVYRNLLHLFQTGKLSQASGIVLGEFLRCDHQKGFGPTIDDLFEHLFDKCSIPVYRTSTFGHGENLNSFPYGKRAHLSEGGLHLEQSLSVSL